MSFEELMNKFRSKRESALAMGGPDKVAAHHAAGKMTTRERVDYLLDDGTFQEMGLFSTSDQPEMAERSACDGKISGFGKIQGRPVGVLSNDLTVLGSSSAVVNGKKIGYIKRITSGTGAPVVFLSEAGGGPHARLHGLPGHGGHGPGPHPVPTAAGGPLGFLPHGPLLRQPHLVRQHVRLRGHAQGRGHGRVQSQGDRPGHGRGHPRAGAGRLEAPRRGDRAHRHGGRDRPGVH